LAKIAEKGIIPMLVIVFITLSRLKIFKLAYHCILLKLTDDKADKSTEFYMHRCVGTKHLKATLHT
jgi:hypothetical protein